MSQLKCSMCDESQPLNRPLAACKSCEWVYCEKCWIYDEKSHFCPWCFCNLTVDEMVKLYNPDQCSVCLDNMTDRRVTLNCGHLMCLTDYSNLLYKQRKSFNQFVEDYQIFPENLIDQCVVCNRIPNRCIILEQKYVWKTVPRNVIPVLRWNMYELYKTISNKKHIPSALLRMLILQYRYFMMVKVYEKDFEATKVSPPPLVDLIWHAHILLSKDYINFCNSVCGQYIHHDPNGGMEKSQKAIRYCNTIEWMRTHLPYLDLKQDVWFNEDTKQYFGPKSSYSVDEDTTRKSIQLFVKVTNGKTHAYHVYYDDCVWKLKALIACRTNICIGSIRLIYSGKNLDEFQTIAHYNIPTESTIHFVMRISGC